jgi:hypothetical protein
MKVAMHIRSCFLLRLCGTALNLAAVGQVPPASFDSPYAYPVGTNPLNIAIGDFNEDGILDLALPNVGPQGHRISILIGEKNGKYRKPAPYSIGGLGFVAVGDFNGDGHLDLASLDFLAINILLGNGDGTFQAPKAASFNVITTPITLAVGDFNRDGKPDLAVITTDYQSGAYILLGNGDGTFQSPIQYAIGSNPVSVAVADVNGDKKLDLIVANSGSNNVSVLLGNGDRHFSAASDLRCGNRPGFRGRWRF